MILLWLEYSRNLIKPFLTQDLCLRFQFGRRLRTYMFPKIYLKIHLQGAVIFQTPHHPTMLFIFFWHLGMVFNIDCDQLGCIPTETASHQTNPTCTSVKLTPKLCSPHPGFDKVCRSAEARLSCPSWESTTTIQQPA